MLLFFSVALIAQKKSSIRILYDVSLATHKSNGNLTKEQKTYNLFAKEAGKSTYILEIDNGKSQFYLNKKMTFDKGNNSKLISAFVGSGIYFYNSELNEALNTKNALGEDFIIESLIKNNWTLSQEKRIINNYTCYKATTIQKFINRIGETKTKMIVAWYSPQLAINFGLKNYHGLPGITILLDEGDVVYKCKEIELNAKIKTKKQKKGKVISQREYNDILKNDFAAKFGLRN